MSAHVLSLFLQAVALVETGDNPQAVGVLGERGRFQMMPVVAASCGGHGEREAARWEKHLERELVAMGVEPLPFNVALAWNAGMTKVRAGKVPVSSYRYAGRVVATMESLRQ